jgi:DNA polymerase III subunit epsilon
MYVILRIGLGQSIVKSTRSRPHPLRTAMTTFVALDFETADHERDSACAIGLVRVEQQQIVERIHYLIRPPRRQILFTHIHGIRWADVAQEPVFGDLWDDISPLLQGVDFIAAHNAQFDQGVLYACCDAHGIQRPNSRFLCTVQLARKTWKLYPTKLPNVCDYLGIVLDHHQALSDAEACAKIVIAAHSGV